MYQYGICFQSSNKIPKHSGTLISSIFNTSFFFQIKRIMAQNISPDRSQSSNLSKQNDEAVTVKDNHAVSKRFVS